MSRFFPIRNWRFGLFTSLTVCLFLSFSSAANARKLYESELNYQGFKARIEAGEVQSPDDLMTVLPQDMLDRYALAFSSRSPHKRFVTPEAPRILMVSDGGFALTLGTLPNQDGKIYADFREFDLKQKRLIPRMIEFDTKNKLSPVIIENPVQFYTHADSQNCVHCHGLDHHDIWDDYKFWPGFFAQGHNQFPQSELEMVQRYLPKFENEQVYRHLSKMILFPLAELSQKTLQISQILGEVNASRITDRLVHSPQFPKYRAAILAALMDMDMTDFLSSEDLALYNQGHETLFTHIENQMKNYYSRIFARLKRFGFDDANMKKTDFNLPQAGKWSKLKFICDRLGVSTEDWWMTLESDTYAGSDGGFGLTYLILKSYVAQLRMTEDQQLLPSGHPDVVGQEVSSKWARGAALLNEQVKKEHCATWLTDSAKIKALGS